MYSFRSSDFAGERERPAKARYRRGQVPDVIVPASGDEQRECARGEWCRGGTAATGPDGERVVTPALGYRAFCDPDRGLIGDCLVSLPGVTDRLSVALGERVAGEVTVRIPFGPSEPIRLDVDAVIRLITGRLGDWHERVASAARLAEPDTDLARARELRNPGGAVRSATGVLAAHLDALLALQPAPMGRWLPLQNATGGAEILASSGGRALVMLGGGHAGNEVLWLEWLGRAVLLETPPRPHLLLNVPCRSCEHLALRRADPPLHDGDLENWSVCSHCRDVLSIGEYLEWTRRLAAFYRPRLADVVAAVEVADVVH